MEYYSTIKRMKILPFATTWVDLEGIVLSDIGHRRTNNGMFSLTCGLKNKYNKTDSQIQGTNQRREGWRKGQDWLRELRGTNY